MGKSTSTLHSDAAKSFQHITAKPWPRQGHGFVRKANTDFQFFAMVLFILAVVG
jgi:hypothetical protein